MRRVMFFACIVTTIFLLITSASQQALAQQHQRENEVSTAKKTAAGDYASLVDPSSSACLDTVPLGDNTCLFGTKYVYISDQKFVNISVSPHIVACGTETGKGPVTAVTVPLNTHFSLREFWMRAKRHRVAVGGAGGERGGAAASSSTNTEFLNNWNFGKGTSALTMFGTTTFDDDTMYVTCSTTSQDDNAADEDVKHNNKQQLEQTLCTITISSPRLSVPFGQSVDIRVGSKEFFTMAHSAYCVSIPDAGAVFTSAAFGRKLYLDADCRDDTSSSSSGGVGISSSVKTTATKRKNYLMWQLAPITQPRYVMTLINGEMRISTGLVVKNAGGPPATCHQASFLSSLYCHSCGAPPSALSSTIPAVIENQMQLHEKKKHDASVGGGRRLWHGPCTSRLIDNPKTSRTLTYEVDATCRPATCVAFKVYSNPDCEEAHQQAPSSQNDDFSSPLLLQQQQQQQQLPADNSGAKKKYQLSRNSREDHDTSFVDGALLVLPCGGGVHDRDSTGAFLHNVFVRCNRQMTRFELFGECDGRWCKAKVEVPASSSSSSSAKKRKDQSHEEGDDDMVVIMMRGKGKTNKRDRRNGGASSSSSSSSCVRVEPGLLSSSDSKETYVQLVRTGVDCHLFGVNVFKKTRKTGMSLFSDTDRFSSRTCIPSRIGGEPTFEPVCVDWDSRIRKNNQHSADGDDGNTNKNVVLRVHFNIDFHYLRTRKSFQQAVTAEVVASNSGGEGGATAEQQQQRDNIVDMNEKKKQQQRQQRDDEQRAFVAQLKRECGSMTSTGGGGEQDLRVTWKPATHNASLEPNSFIAHALSMNSLSWASSSSLLQQRRSLRRATVELFSWSRAAALLSLTPTVLQSRLGVLTFAVEKLPPVELFSTPRTSGDEKTGEKKMTANADDDDELNELSDVPRYVLPKTMRSGGFSYDIEERSGGVGPAPTRAPPGTFRKWSLLLGAEGAANHNNKHQNDDGRHDADVDGDGAAVEKTMRRKKGNQQRTQQQASSSSESSDPFDALILVTGVVVLVFFGFACMRYYRRSLKLKSKK